MGTALLVSVVFRSVIASIVACAAALSAVIALPYVVANLYMISTPALWELSISLNLFFYWMPANYYYGDLHDTSVGIAGFTATNFLVCLISATLPLLAALWLFHRRAY